MAVFQQSTVSEGYSAPKSTEGNVFRIEVFQGWQTSPVDNDDIEDEHASDEHSGNVDFSSEVNVTAVV